jgi:hypothetical protein
VQPAPISPSGGREPGPWGGTAPAPDQQLTPDQLRALRNAPTYDDGGWLMPGLSWNLARTPEPVLAPREKDNLEAIAKGGSTSGLNSMVHIEHLHMGDGDGRKAGRDIAREMLAYQRGGVR